MSLDSRVLDSSLASSRVRWRWIKFVSHSAIVGSLFCALTLGLGAAIRLGMITTKAGALTVLSILCIAGFGAWVAGAIRALTSSPERTSLAARVERLDPRFQDRLNTLLFLEKKSSGAATSFGCRIAAQTRRILNQKKPTAAFSVASSGGWVGLFLLMVGAVFWFNHQYSPWNRLVNLAVSEKGLTRKHSTEQALGPTNRVEGPEPWGEVRITEPGRDLKVTKVDVVPLSLEAAANRDLKSVSWYTSINGTSEQAHVLPAPKEPRFATYQPILYLDEFSLSDWDVMTYYAKADTSSNSYASEVFFLEVRPFREDIDKMPGGEGGQAYGTINEITSLIGRQQQVIRDTHRYVQRPPPQEQARAQDRQKLSQAEIDLSNAARNLYGDMAANMENKPIGEALDSLARSEASLARAGGLLKDSVLPKAQAEERAGLADLVASRQIFQKAVSDHPGDFSPQEGDRPSLANSKKIAEMAEFRDEAKSAQEFVQHTLQEQKEVESQARAASGQASTSQLAGQEQQLEQELKRFTGEHPRGFKGSESDSARAQHSLQNAGEKLGTAGSDGSVAAHEATRDLEKLSAAMQMQSQGQSLSATRQTDALQPEPESQFAEGISELRSLLMQLEQKRGISPADQASQARQALANLQSGLRRQSDPDASNEPLLQQLAQVLAVDGVVDAATLKGLLQQFERFSVEASPKTGEKIERPEMANIDLTRLPPAYRGRIEKYFQKLSEQ